MSWGRVEAWTYEDGQHFDDPRVSDLLVAVLAATAWTAAVSKTRSGGGVAVVAQYCSLVFHRDFYNEE